ANDQGASYALILGDDELANGQVQVKALATGEQATVPLESVSQSIFDLLFGDVVATEHGAQLPSLAQRLTTA
ncbi:His/Gly/Thr/Pro-type tRNA ligase C-terminal domain-containing protein, partial [Staphylococcus aureus]|nr:His/Gly/Thr/Pro-type tRNA ligase C-terminal domain-containing protein [Staphylococcus aureus]